MANINQKGPFYRLLKLYVGATFKGFYSEYIVVGKENLPQEGKAVYGANHLNALMDALAMLSVVPGKQSMVFLARADIFGNKMAARLLRFLKILPAYRARNGFENLGKNEEVFEECTRILCNNNCIGIMPEGNQTLQHKIRPLVKGIFRIAFMAQEKLGDKESVKLLPVGIDMGDLIMPGGHIIIQLGKPVEVLDYMQSYKENPVVAMNQIRVEFRQRLKDLTVDYATDKYYDCFEATGNILNLAMLRKMELSDNTLARFDARQAIAKRLLEIEKENPEQIERLAQFSAEFQQGLKEAKLGIQTFDKKPSTALSVLGQCLLLTIFFPVFLVGLLLNGPAFFGTRGISKALKFESLDFFSSVHYVLGILITFPFFHLLNTVLFACFTSLAWWWIVLFFFSQFWVGKFAFRWHKSLQSLINKVRYRSLAKKNVSLLEKLKSLYQRMSDIVLG